MGDTQFAVGSQTQALMVNRGHPDVNLLTPPPSYKATASRFENGHTTPRTADIHDAFACPETQLQHDVFRLGGDDLKKTNTSLVLPIVTPRTKLAATHQHRSGFQEKLQIAQHPNSFSIVSRFLRLPLEIRLQIYHWVLLLGDAGSSVDTSTASKGKPVHGMQHLDTGDIIMFRSLASDFAHKTPVEYRAIKPNRTPTPERDGADGSTRTAKSAAASVDIPLLAAHRPIGGALPMGLLASCRQIYREARLLAFETSEFVFVRLFSSGLSTAYAFIVLGTRSYHGILPRLQPWQRDHMRYVRLELDVSVADMGWSGPQRDLQYMNKGANADADAHDTAKKQGHAVIDAAKWLALCDALRKGLHGLRLLLNITGERQQRSGIDSEALLTGAGAYGRNNGRKRINDERGGKDDRDDRDDNEAAAADVAQSILVQGLRRLAALRQLEVELIWAVRGRLRSRAVNMMPAATQANLDWCFFVERALNSEQRQLSSSVDMAYRPGKVNVVCVERI